MIYVTIPGKGLRIPKVTEVAALQADLQCYRDGKLWYGIGWNTPVDPSQYPPQFTPPEKRAVQEEWWFEFPVPLDDPAATGEFLVEMKAITLIRWIRKHIEYLKEAQRG